MFGWPLTEVRMAGGWQAYLEQKKSWVQGKKTIFIFDEAQFSYEDSSLWGEFFKELPNYDDQFAIAFASYGSPTSSVNLGNGSSTSVSNFGTQSTPFSVDDWQRVTLCPIDSDGIGAVGLLFSRMEFDDLVCKKFPSPDYYFHSSFFDAVFNLTDGHAGAIRDFVNTIAGLDVCFFMMSEHHDII